MAPVLVAAIKLIIMNKDILAFIQKQTAATISCIDDHAKPYCFTVFYAWDDENKCLIYKSSPETNHSKILSHNTFVAGTIHPDKLNKLLVQGIQFEGQLLRNDDPLTKGASMSYHRRHPLAIVKPGELWVIKVTHIKMTDSTKGFGTKLRWLREAEL
ncbi:MAG: hypothetical protein BGN92_00650 [Sphingobacteriales bacterium 41-5]|nr:MAG: hypothetical protein BGN92_00650 [Sphingobacteriales bacterium 41-5]